MRGSLWIYRKQLIVYSLTLVSYLASIYTVFFQINLITGSIRILVFLFFTHFAAISAKQYTIPIRKRNWVLWIIVSGAILAVTTHYNPVLLYIAYIVLHMGLYFFVVAKHDVLNTHSSLHPRHFANVGMYLFTVFCTIAYSILLVGIIGRIPFDCASIAQGYDTAGSRLTKPLEQGREKIQGLITSSNKATIAIDVGTTLPIQGLINTSVWDSIMGEREKINANICNSIFDSIQTQFSKPGFQAAIIFPLFLLLSPIVRIILYLLSTFIIIIIELLIKLKIYRTRTVTREVQEWY